MTLFLRFTLIFLLVINCACGTSVKSSLSNSSSAPGLTNANGTVPAMSGTNVMTVNVGGTTLCNADSYVNEPCTEVTICPAGSSTGCQTISNILVDTGSYGLRIFSSALSVSLTQETNSSNKNIAECALFGSGSTWGPVETANVIMGGESAVTIPIQVINSSYASIPSACGTPDSSPSTAGYNGILGVGLFAQDCGSTCVTSANNEMYYTCSGTTCTEATATLAEQVVNPVSALTTDNNGVMMIMPTVAFTGNSANSGYLVLGIGTETNNKPSGTSTFTADEYGDMTASISGSSKTSFIDSGSNGFFIPATSSYPACTANGYTDWFCPTSNYTSTGTVTGQNGVSKTFSYQIGNAQTLFSYDAYALMNLGGTLSSYIDLGLPFFYGKTIYVGLENKTSTVGTGPYWAY